MTSPVQPLPPSVSRYLYPKSKKMELLPAGVDPPPTPVAPPCLAGGLVTSATSKVKASAFSSSFFTGCQVALFRNLHVRRSQPLAEPEVHKMWLSYRSNALHLAWVSSSDRAPSDTRLETIDLSRVILVEDTETVKYTTDCGAELEAKVVTLQTLKQKMGFGVVRKEDFGDLSECLKASVKTSSKAYGGSSGRQADPARRRLSHTLEPFTVADFGKKSLRTDTRRVSEGMAALGRANWMEGIRGVSEDTHSTFSTSSGRELGGVFSGENHMFASNIEGGDERGATKSEEGSESHQSESQSSSSDSEQEEDDDDEEEDQDSSSAETEEGSAADSKTSPADQGVRKFTRKRCAKQVKGDAWSAYINSSGNSNPLFGSSISINSKGNGNGNDNGNEYEYENENENNNDKDGNEFINVNAEPPPPSKHG